MQLKLRVTLTAASQTALLGAALLAGGGCATVATAPSSNAGGATDERTRAEQVFLYQSRVADALLDRYPMQEQFAGADPALVAAEARMTEACSPLTQAVLARYEGEEPSLMLRLQVMNTIDDCERAARDTEHLISSTSAETAAPTI